MHRPRTLSGFTMPPPADIVKVAIEWPGAYPKLMEIDQVGNARSPVGVTLGFLSLLEFSDFGWLSFSPRLLSGCVAATVAV